MRSGIRDGRRGPVMKFFGLFGNCVPSGKLRTFGKGRSLFFLSPVLYFQISSLLFLFSFSFSLSLSSLRGKGRLRGWLGERRSMFFMVYDPSAFKGRNSPIWASSLGLLPLKGVSFQEEALCHNGLLLSSNIKIAPTLQLNTFA